MFKRWTANSKISFGILVFSLTMMAPFSAYAQEVEEDGLAPALEAEESQEEAPPTQQVVQREATRSNVQNAGQSSLSTQPVVVTSSMSPTQVPAALPARTYADQRGIQQSPSSLPQGMIVSAPGTGIGGSNPGNANTGGVQVQSVTVQANPQADASQANGNVSDILRRNRIKNEIDNENRLIERLEMGRLEDERMRAQSVDSFQSSVGNSAVANDHSQAASAQTSGDQSPATAVAAGPGSTVTVQQVGSIEEDNNVKTVPVHGSGSMYAHKHHGDGNNNFGIMPFVGYRWYTSDNYYFDVNNIVTTGILMEGAINRYFGIEGGFTYSRDEIEDVSGIGGAYGYYGGGYYYGMPTRERDNYEVTIGAKVGNNFGRFRPYGVLGLGARQSRYDIDNQYTTAQADQAGWQRSTNKILGLGALGFDVRLGSGISLGGRFDYLAVLNKEANYMDMLYNDSSNSYQGSATLKVSF